MHDHPIIYLRWYNTSNYLSALSVATEKDLHALIQKLNDKGIKYSVFKEPDVDNRITAIAIEPGEASSKLTSSIPCALKELNNNNQINKNNYHEKIS